MSANHREVYDHIIVGAGPAGCFCGIRLAEKGKKVLILEKNALTDRKVCGDGISLRCVRLLRKIGFPTERFVEAGAASIHKRIVIRHGKSKTTYFGSEDGVGAYGIPRDKTDRLFREYTAEKGVTILYGREVTEIGKEGDCFTVGEFAAKDVILAIGAAGRVKVSGQTVRQEASALAVGIAMTVECESGEEPCFLFDYDEKYGGQYAWIFKTDVNHWNVGVWLRGNREKLREYFDEFVKEKAAAFLGSDYRVICPPRGAIMAVRKFGAESLLSPRIRTEGVHLIGDADLTSKEADGEGIRQAIISGISLADKLAKG